MDIQTVEDIISQITELESDYQENKALILSEDDLKCQIFRKIYPLFDHNQVTMDNNIKGSPLHTEIKFFDENGKLSLIPDITVLNPNDLSIIHAVKFRITSRGIKYKRTSSKEFEFAGDTIIIELKFCKNKTGISQSNVVSYEKDINKIKRIQEIVNTRSEGRNKVFGIFVIFNKTNIANTEFQRFMLSNQSLSELRVIYGTGNLGANAGDDYILEF